MDKTSSSRPLSLDIAQAAREITVILEKTDSPRNSKLPSAVADLTYRGLRHWGLAQVRANRLAPKLPSTEILAVLAIAWAALREQLRADHVVVDEAVAAVKALAGEKRGNFAAQTKLAGFVNALLRKTLSDPAAALRDLEDPVAKWNAPLWWIQKIQADYAERSPAVLAALACRGALTLRLSPLAPVMADYIALLAQHGFQGIQVGPHAVVVRPAAAVERIPGFSDGLVSVQDASAQWAGELFSDLNPTHVLDACAAPGGKTIALAQHLSATVWAMDQSSARLERLIRDLPRVQKTLRGTIKTIQADVLKPAGWPTDGLPKQFDAILLDAPCSASGVTRRHPEIAWRRDPQSIAYVVDIQRRMLDILWRRLKPGGELVFVTCSVFSEEGEEQQQAFLERTPDAVLMPSPGRCLPIANPEGGQDQDGFFFAKFKKRLGTDDATSFNSAAVAGDSDASRHGQ